MAKGRHGSLQLGKRHTAGDRREGTPFVSAHVQTDGKRHELHTCLPLAWRPREGRLQHRRLVRGEELGVGAGVPLQPRLCFPERSRLLRALPRRRSG